MSFKREAFKVIRLIIEEPRSHTELLAITGQHDTRLRSTLRALQAEGLISPRGNRYGDTGRPQTLFEWRGGNFA
jgi:DNA-binding IclR family transcriptional regulator